MNLTCGRNPWKRASVEDSTFKAYLRDPTFLRSILPLSMDLEYILQRIFECDPSRRITLAELRTLILQCPAFTCRSSAMPSPLCHTRDHVRPAEFDSLPADLDRDILSPPEDFAQPVSFVPDSQQHSPLPGSLVTQFLQLSTGGASSGSDSSSVFSASPTSSSSSSSQSSFNSVSSRYSPSLTTQTEPPQSFTQYITPMPSAWYTNFMPALDLAQKHVSFQPFFPGVRIF